MRALKDHFAEHHVHLLGCGIAALFVLAAIVLGLPLLGVVAALFCGAMMIGMVWMMVSTAARSRHH